MGTTALSYLLRRHNLRQLVCLLSFQRGNIFDGLLWQAIILSLLELLQNRGNSKVWAKERNMQTVAMKIGKNKASVKHLFPLEKVAQWMGMGCEKCRWTRDGCNMHLVT